MLLKRVYKTAFTFLKERDSMDSSELSNTNPVCYSCISQASMWLTNRHVIRKTINDDNQLCVLCYWLSSDAVGWSRCTFAFQWKSKLHRQTRKSVDLRSTGESLSVRAEYSASQIFINNLPVAPVALHLMNLKLGFKQFGDAVRVICHSEERRRCMGEKERNMQGEKTESGQCIVTPPWQLVPDDACT